MSRQNQKPRLLIVPDEISGPPGETEAAEIRRLYATSQEGIRAFVLMGFHLIEVKSRIPHGGYMAWLATNLPDLGKSHLHRSRQVAEAVALQLGWDGSNFPRVGHLETLPGEVCELIDGKSGRSLIAELREPLSEEAEKAETACRIECEKMWKASPEKRDDWEPRVLSGELTYHLALTGMLGSKLTKGQAKQPVRPHEIMMSAAGKLATHFASFEGLPPLAQSSVLEEIRRMAEVIPAACREAMLEAWKGAQA